MQFLKSVKYRLGMEKYKVLLVDDHQILLDGTRQLMQNLDLYEVKDAATTGMQAIELMKTNDYDILITDYQLPDISGVELVKIASSVLPDMKIIVLSMHDDPAVVKELLKEGVAGYMLKNDSQSSLLEALDKVTDGKRFLSDDISDLLINQLNEPEEKSVLSPRETEIIKLIAKDYSTKQIAEILFISEKTVETHRKNILRKTNCSTVVGLVNYVHERKLI